MMWICVSGPRVELNSWLSDWLWFLSAEFILRFSNSTERKPKEGNMAQKVAARRKRGSPAMQGWDAVDTVEQNEKAARVRYAGCILWI